MNPDLEPEERIICISISVSIMNKFINNEQYNATNTGHDFFFDHLRCQDILVYQLVLSISLIIIWEYKSDVLYEVSNMVNLYHYLIFVDTITSLPYTSFDICDFIRWLQWLVRIM